MGGQVEVNIVASKIAINQRAGIRGTCCGFLVLTKNHRNFSYYLCVYRLTKYLFARYGEVGDDGITPKKSGERFVQFV